MGRTTYVLPELITRNWISSIGYSGRLQLYGELSLPEEGLFLRWVILFLENEYQFEKEHFLIKNL
jgi:hypothetical protein